MKYPVRKWFAIVLLIKIFYFVFFIVFRNPQWPEHELVNGMALCGGDTHVYYTPLEMFVNGEGYQTLCKMPGLLPLYAPLRLVLDEPNSKIAILFIQILLDALTVILLAIVAARIFSNAIVFQITALVFGLSTFVSIFSNYLLSDSLNTSFIILSIFFLSNYFENKKIGHLWVAGFFIAWATFVRPSTLMVFPFIASVLLLHSNFKFGKWIKANIIYTMPLSLLIACWLYRNVTVYNKKVFFIDSVENCLFRFSNEQESIRTFLLTIGEDIQPWSNGSGSEWFFNRKIDPDLRAPFKENDFASAYNIDSLVTLKENYFKF